MLGAGIAGCAVKAGTRSCLECGRAFEPRYRASTQQWCSRECVRAATKAGDIDRHRAWTDFEIGELEGLSNLSARDAGKHLGRSMQSVQHMRNKLRDGWFPGARERWTDDELEMVRRTPHLTAEQVSDKLGTRSVCAVNSARGKLHATEGISFGEVGSHKNPHEVGSRRLLAKTCIGCGLLLDASWFSKVNGGKKWLHRCRRCIQVNAKTGEKYEQSNGYRKDGGASARASAAKLQKLTRERASRHGFPWMDGDHVILRDTSLTVFEKAIRLGRTWSATHMACSVNGYTSRVGRGDPMHGVWRIDNPNEAKAGAE